MSYIEKEKLIKADIASIENRVRHAFNQGYDLGFKTGKEKAKPQEQEVIDKIRAEILRISSYGGYELGGYKDGYLNAMANVLSIIDKHTIGSEKE